MRLFRVSDKRWVNLDLVTDIAVTGPGEVIFYQAVGDTSNGGQVSVVAKGKYADKAIVWLDQQARSHPEMRGPDA